MADFIHILNRLIQVWPEYRSHITTNKEHEAHVLVHQELPRHLESWTADPMEYKFSGSDGQGNILRSPWLAVFNPEITERASQGYYVVYLLSEDLQYLVLEIGFGAEQFSKRYGEGRAFFKAIGDAVEGMRSSSAHLLNEILEETKLRINSVPVSLARSSDFKLKAYESCAIYSLTYDLAQPPSEESLKTDYLEFLHLYDRMSESLLLADVEDYVLETFPASAPAAISEVSAFVPRPPKKTRANRNGAKSRSGARRSKRADKIGKLGEEWVFNFEREFLNGIGRGDLAEKVIWHRNHKPDRTPGWDITSWTELGEIKYIEVKSSEGDVINEVILTRKEWDTCRSPALAHYYYIYLLRSIISTPRLEILRDPHSYVVGNHLAIEIESYSLSLQSIEGEIVDEKE